MKSPLTRPQLYVGCLASLSGAALVTFTAPARAQGAPTTCTTAANIKALGIILKLKAPADASPQHSLEGVSGIFRTTPLMVARRASAAAGIDRQARMSLVQR